MPQSARPLFWIVCLAGAITFGVTAWRLIDSPLRFDETDFASQGQAITRYGIPKIPYTETRLLSTPAEQAVNHTDARYGLWHPPLYFYSLAAAFAVLGSADWAPRAAGLIWFGLTLAVAWRATGAGRGQIEGGRLQRALPLGLALLSPLIAQGALYLDIDNTSLAFGLVLFASVFTFAPHDDSWRRTALLSTLLLLCLWSKLTTPYVLLAAVGLYRALDGQLFRGIRQTLLIGAIATAAFAVTYLAYCHVTGYPADFMFRISYLGKRQMYLSPGPAVAKLHAIWWNVVWFSPALTLLLLLMTLDRAWHYRLQRRLAPADFWILFSWACWGVYAFWGGLVGKYSFPAAVAAAIALGQWLPGQLKELHLKAGAVLGVAVAGLLIFHIVALAPLEVKAPTAAGASLGFRDALTDPRNLSLAATFAGFAVFGVLAGRSIAGVRLAGRLAALLLICAVVANTVDCLKLMLSPDDRSPYRPFRERGFREVVQVVNESLDGADVVIMPKDLGYYFHGRYYALEGIRDYDGMDAIVPVIRQAGIRHVVDSTANPVVPNALLGQAGLLPTQQVGDFVIYETIR